MFYSIDPPRQLYQSRETTVNSVRKKIEKLIPAHARTDETKTL